MESEIPSMDLSWLEFGVIIACGLGGFFITNAVLEARRVPTKGERKGEDEAEAAERASRSKNEEPQHPKERPWWETLGVSREASSDEIKSAFRREIAKYHPDRVEGLGKELRELAEQKAKEINQAYVVAKRERRF
jgi:hypothetical protein